MKDFMYSYPTKVYFGDGAAEKALQKELAGTGKTIMLAYGRGSEEGILSFLLKLPDTIRNIRLCLGSFLTTLGQCTQIYNFFSTYALILTGT